MTKSTLSPELKARKRAFRVALAERDMTASEFAEMQGVTRQALSAVLNGVGASDRLSKAIERFITTVAKRKEVAA